MLTCKRLTVLASLALLAGCASLGSAPPGEVRQCMPHETLVCYGKSASKLDKPDDGTEFCRCENALDRF